MHFSFNTAAASFLPAFGKTCAVAATFAKVFTFNWFSKPGSVFLLSVSTGNGELLPASVVVGFAFSSHSTVSDCRIFVPPGLR